MKFKSTRGNAPIIGFSEALFTGLATDGGLYVPEALPQIDFSQLLHGPPLPAVAELILSAYVDEGPIKDNLGEICRRAFNFEIKLSSFDKNTSTLELYHGPTAAFKDVGARFLAECISRLSDETPRTVIVATSGDTGGAVAAAFHLKPHLEVIILFPKDRISAFQEKQLTCWGDNVYAFKVRGTFDDCQQIVKQALLSADYAEKNLVSANSINIGRILPQASYYAWSSLEYFAEHQQEPSYIVPTGNLGNALAALWAKKMGFPIGKVVLACNANRAIVDFLEDGSWQPRPALSTLANAMDVGSASNMERLRHLYPTPETLRKDVQAFSVSDAEISETITAVYKKTKKMLCPHSATAAFVRTKLAGDHWIIVETAHAAKFRSSVEPLVKGTLTDPPALRLFQDSPSRFTEIDPHLEGLTRALVELKPNY